MPIVTKAISSMDEENLDAQTRNVAAVELGRSTTNDVTPNATDETMTAPTTAAGPGNHPETSEVDTMTDATARVALTVGATDITTIDVTIAEEAKTLHAGNTVSRGSPRPLQLKHRKQSTYSQDHPANRETTKLRCKCRIGGAKRRSDGTTVGR